MNIIKIRKTVRCIIRFYIIYAFIFGVLLFSLYNPASTEDLKDDFIFCRLSIPIYVIKVGLVLSLLLLIKLLFSFFNFSIISINFPSLFTGHFTTALEKGIFMDYKIGNFSISH